MSEQRHDPLIPPLHDEDFLDADLELIFDTNLLAEFQTLRLTNPRLARKILLAAHSELVEDPATPDMTSALRSHMGIIKAIELGLKRNQETTIASVNDDGEGLQPSSELQPGS